MKAELLQQTLECLRSEWEHLAQAARNGRNEASDDENRSESKYDTRGLEAGYLAEGQAAQANQLEEQIAYLSRLQIDDTAPHETVTRGSVVILSGPDSDDETFFILPFGGGTELNWQSQSLTVLTPEAPLGHQLMGRAPGDFLNDGRYISELF